MLFDFDEQSSNDRTMFLINIAFYIYIYIFLLARSPISLIVTVLYLCLLPHFSNNFSYSEIFLTNKMRESVVPTLANVICF